MKGVRGVGRVVVDRGRGAWVGRRGSTGAQIGDVADFAWGGVRRGESQLRVGVNVPLDESRLTERAPATPPPPPNQSRPGSCR